MSTNNIQTRKVAMDKQDQKPFEQPKLTYIKPKLSKQGKVAQVTQSFFGSFSP